MPKMYVLPTMRIPQQQCNQQHPTQQLSTTPVPPKPTAIPIQSLWTMEDSLLIPTSPPKWSPSKKSSTIWKSKSMLPILLLTPPSNTIFERYSESNFLPTCLPVTILSSTSILPYKYDNNLILSSTNLIPITSKMKSLNLSLLYDIKQ